VGANLLRPLLLAAPPGLVVVLRGASECVFVVVLVPSCGGARPAVAAALESDVTAWSAEQVRWVGVQAGAG
jgi:hypothetical protein